MFRVRGRSLVTSVLVAFTLAISMVGLQAPPAVAAVAPTVSGVSPGKGPLAGGTTVTVTGTDFTGVKQVLFGTRPGTSVKVTSATTLTVIAPSGSAGVVDVRVAATAGTSTARDTDKYTFLAAPTISRLSPVRGTIAGGTTVAVTGTGFEDVTSVLFGTTKATNLTVTSGTELSVVTPKHAAGRVDVRIVSSSRGTTARTTTDRFTFVGAPKITRITPVTGSTNGGTRVKITGSNLIDITTATFGATAGTALAVSSPTKLYVTAPAGTPGTINMTVTGAHGTSAPVKAARFTYIAPPVITKLGPAAGTYKGGTTITLTGTSFKTVKKVLFDGKPGTKVKVASATKLTVKTPKHAPGTVDVQVVTGYGTSPAGDTSKYVYLGKPIITGITPATGTIFGGKTIHITGTGLTGTTKILFGTASTAAGLKVVSDTELAVIAPTHPAGQVDLRAVNSRGTSPTSIADRYTYQTPIVPNAVTQTVQPGTETAITAGEGYGVTIPAGALTAPSAVTVTPLPYDNGSPKVDVTIGGTWQGSVTVSMPAAEAADGQQPVLLHEATDGKGPRVSSGTGVTTSQAGGTTVLSTDLTSLSAVSSSTTDCGNLTDSQKDLAFLCQNNTDRSFNDWSAATAQTQASKFASLTQPCNYSGVNATVQGNVPYGMSCVVSQSGATLTVDAYNNATGQVGFWSVGAAYQYSATPAGSYTSTKVSIADTTPLIMRPFAQAFSGRYLTPGSVLHLTKGQTGTDTTLRTAGSALATADYQGIQILIGLLGDTLLNWGATDPAIIAKFTLCASKDLNDTITSCLRDADIYLLKSALAYSLKHPTFLLKAGTAATLQTILKWADIGSYTTSLAIAIQGLLAEGTTTLHNPDPANLVTAVAAGGEHTCALTGAGTVKCWGENWIGDLGDGTTTDRHHPVKASGLSGVTAITAGYDHTCALIRGGTIKCWGQNANGQLGEGAGFSSNVPADVPGVTAVTAIAAGGWHTCALLSGGNIKCWGNNEHGQLGDGSHYFARSSPVQVTGLAGATAISAGGQHTCAILQGGTVKCWGYNEEGALGIGTTTDSYSPVGVAGLTGVIAIAAGSDHTCALMGAGTVKCWGTDSIVMGSSSPVALNGLTGITAIAAGGDHTCAVVSGGSVDCGGLNDYGQLGDGTNTNRFGPGAVPGLTGITAIAAGLEHTCVVASAVAVSCWGWNEHGQLGDGTTTDRSSPVKVTGL